MMASDADKKDETSKRSFSWWEKQHWKPQPPAGKEYHRPGFPHDSKAATNDLPQGEQKWRANNPKKRKPA